MVLQVSQDSFTFDSFAAVSHITMNKEKKRKKKKTPTHTLTQNRNEYYQFIGIMEMKSNETGT